MWRTELITLVLGMTHLLTYCTVSVCNTVNTIIYIYKKSTILTHYLKVNSAFLIACHTAARWIPLSFVFFSLFLFSFALFQWEKQNAIAALRNLVCVSFSFILPNNTAVERSIENIKYEHSDNKNCVDRVKTRRQRKRCPIEFFPFSLFDCMRVNTVARSYTIIPSVFSSIDLSVG